jgi:hypothetical protein
VCLVILKIKENFRVASEYSTQQSKKAHKKEEYITPSREVIIDQEIVENED